MSLLDLPRVARELTWPRDLPRGSAGADVRRLQEWLGLRGAGTALDGEYGPATRAAVTLFQQRERLPVTGLADRRTLEALCAPLRRAFAYEVEAPSLRAAVVATTQRHLAQHPREIGGDNRGPWVRAYCGADGAAFRWCAGFALSIVRQACESLDVSMPVPFTLSCDELATTAASLGRLTHNLDRVKPGDLGLCYRGQGAGKDWFHVYVVTGVHVDHTETGEGNTNDEGSANGYEACARTRGLAQKDYLLLG